MAYWRMQLHPADPENAMAHAVRSVAAGFIGLDFAEDPGDLRLADYASLPPEKRDYWAFAHEMQREDRVLVIVHHFPFSLVTVDGDYNYITRSEPELGVWFRHFRRIREARFYADHVTNVKEWQNLVMTDTISILNDPGTMSYRLIEKWGVDGPS